MANTFVFEDDDQPQPAFDSGEPETPEEQQPEEGGEQNNRTFLFAAIGLGAVVLISLICMAVYALVILPQRKTAQAALAASNESTAIAATATAVVAQVTQVAALFTNTPQPTETPLVPTNTPVIFNATETPGTGPTLESGTATQQALYTQLAMANSTATKSAALTGSAPKPTGPAGTSTAKAAATQTAAAKKLSNTGFADDVGLPGMFGLALVLVAVILLARRLRAAPISQ